MENIDRLLFNNTHIACKSILYKIEKYHKIDSDDVLKVDLEGAKNEYVSYQIIIYSKNDVKYDIKVTDLKNGNDVISKKNIDIYSAYYNEIKTSPNNYPQGFYPDVLIPIKDRIAYGDNVIEAHSNQAIYFSIHIPVNTIKGLYKGYVRVIVDGKTRNIPLNLAVFDYVLPIKTHVKSAFAIWGPTYKSTDMLTNIYGDKARKAEIDYFKFLLNYRVSPTCLPIKDLSSPHNIVKTMLKYAPNQKCSSYIIPLKKCRNDKYDEWFDEKLLKKTIHLMVKNSTNELNLFKKAYIYDIIDEPDYTGQYDKARDFLNTINDIISDVLVKEEFKGKEKVKKSLKDIYSLMTLGRWDDELKRLGDNITGYCFKFSLFDNFKNIDDFGCLQNKGKHIWAYGCNFPGIPYTTYQIDSDPLYQRMIGALMFRYNIEGNLFWCVNVSRFFDGNQYTVNFDPFSSFYAFSNWPGDGYLLVKPGRYNEKTTKPYPTLRLLLIREGQQDYDFLYNLYKNKNNHQKEFFEKEFLKICNGAKPINDVNAFLNFRKVVINEVLK